ncbi:MAG: hypothetical protein IJ480_11005 [Clostridia bacterium]|nr:hypothetical protein [Clostridia bacterium]
MKPVRILLICLTLLLLLTACVKEEESMVLTGIYNAITENMLPEGVMRVSAVIPYRDGYVFLLYRRPDYTDPEAMDEGVVICHTDGEGNVTEEITVSLSARVGDPNRIFAGEKGVVVCPLDTDGYRMICLDWEGNRTADRLLKDVTGLGSLPEFMGLAETETGYVLMTGKTCLILDASLQQTGKVSLPGNGRYIFSDDGKIWAVYREDGSMRLGLLEGETVTAAYTLPLRFQTLTDYEQKAVAAVRDGRIYGWDSYGLYSWDIQEDPETAVTDMMSFVNSAVAGEYVHGLSLLPEDRMAVVQVRADVYDYTLVLYEPAPDRDLSQVTYVNLVCYNPEYNMTTAVIEYNKTHPDVIITVDDYTRFNNAENMTAGYDRLVMDMTNRLVEADIVFINQLSDVGECLDLYPFMTGEVQPEDLFGCIENTFGEDGKLYGIPAQFYLNTIAGRTDVLGDLTHWDMEAFLDFTESLGEGEYLMEEISRTDYAYTLFGHYHYRSFLPEDTAAYDTTLYSRYLALLDTLPAAPQKYFQRGTNINEVLAGVAAEPEEGVAGENLYHTGDIKLMSGQIRSFNYLLRLYNTLGTTDVTHVGYPNHTEGSIGVGYDYGLYAIPLHSRYPELAWDFIEYRLLRDTEPREYRHEFERSNVMFFPLKEAYLDTVESLVDWEMFCFYNGSYLLQEDIEPDEKGRYLGEPGTLISITADMVEELENLLDSAGIPGCGDMWRGTPYDLRSIINEEESRYLSGAITAEQCADNVQSRVRIWLAENE